MQGQLIVHVSWKRSVRTGEAPETCPCSAARASLPRQSSPVDDTHAVAARSKRESEQGLHSVRPILLVGGKPLCALTRSRANANVRPRPFVSKQTGMVNAMQHKRVQQVTIRNHTKRKMTMLHDTV